MLKIISKLSSLSANFLSLERLIRNIEVVFIIIIVNRRVYLYYLLF